MFRASESDPRLWGAFEPRLSAQETDATLGKRQYGLAFRPSFIASESKRWELRDFLPESMLTTRHLPAQALSDEPSDAFPDGHPTEKIRAVSDFAPIKERVRRYVARSAQGAIADESRRGPKRRRDIVREGWAYHVSRWPLLVSWLRLLGRKQRLISDKQGLIFTIIFLEFLSYLVVRQLVNVIEYFSACALSSASLPAPTNAQHRARAKRPTATTPPQRQEL